MKSEDVLCQPSLLMPLPKTNTNGHLKIWTFIRINCLSVSVTSQEVMILLCWGKLKQGKAHRCTVASISSLDKKYPGCGKLYKQ